jgi:hypothetical protein
MSLEQVHNKPTPIGQVLVEDDANIKFFDIQACCMCKLAQGMHLNWTAKVAIHRLSFHILEAILLIIN